MSGRIAFPFLTLPDSAIDFAGWLIGNPDQPLMPAGDVLENWDYARDLEISTTLGLDLAVAADLLAVPSDQLRLAVVLKAGTGVGAMPRRVDVLSRQSVPIGESRVQLSSRLFSEALSGRLWLQVSLVVDSIGDAAGRLSPKWRGARVWQSEKDILLEDGGSSRFPLELLSFSQAFAGLGHTHAPWYLDWQPGNFLSDFGGAVRVYINSDIPEIATRVSEGDSITLQAILGDVMAQITADLLDTDECEDVLSECGANSVAHQVRNWIDIAFPGTSLPTIRSMKEHMPGRFRATLLAAAEVGPGS